MKGTMKQFQYTLKLHFDRHFSEIVYYSHAIPKQTYLYSSWFNVKQSTL